DSRYAYVARRSRSCRRSARCPSGRGRRSRTAGCRSEPARSPRPRRRLCSRRAVRGGARADALRAGRASRAQPASQTALMELRPSTELTRRELAELFTAAYEDYYVPFQIDEARLAHMVDTFYLALDRSLVAWEGDTPVGLANLGLRGERTWLGGVGVVKTHRRSGIGEKLTRALLDGARKAGAREMVLEVITRNEPAIALYEKLGFRTIRELE